MFVCLLFVCLFVCPFFLIDGAVFWHQRHNYISPTKPWRNVSKEYDQQSDYCWDYFHSYRHSICSPLHCNNLQMKTKYKKREKN